MGSGRKPLGSPGLPSKLAALPAGGNRQRGRRAARSLTAASSAMEAVDKTALRLVLIAANRPGSRRADGP